MSNTNRMFTPNGEVFEVSTLDPISRPVEELQVPEPITDALKTKQLPDPSGYHLLCAVPNVEVKFENTTLVRPETMVQQDQFATVVLFVLKVGPDAYTDKVKFPSGPWCKEGDFVVTRQYSGTRLRIHGKEFRILNDDQVQGVVQDPRGISRV